MSSITEKFKVAANEVMKLKTKPSNDDLLSLYALYKQATEGDVQGQRPGMLDVKGRKKYDSWAKIAGMSAPQAEEKYIQLVEKLKKS